MASFKRAFLCLAASPQQPLPSSSILFIFPHSIPHPHTTHNKKTKQKPCTKNKNTNTQPSLQSPLHHNTTHSPSFVPFFQPLALLPSSSPFHSNSTPTHLEATFPHMHTKLSLISFVISLCHSPLILPSIALAFSYHLHLTTTTPSSSFSTVSSLRHPSSSPSSSSSSSDRTNFFLLLPLHLLFPTDPPTADPSRLRKP